jgi:hypothetical protein
MTLLEVESVDLGLPVRTLRLSLFDEETEQPLPPARAVPIWAEILGVVFGAEAVSLDFFSQTRRVKDFCTGHDIAYRMLGGERCLSIASPSAESLVQLAQRFYGDLFGCRAGNAASADPELERDLMHRGIDAYADALDRYAALAVIELYDGQVTLFSDRFTASELARQLQPIAARHNLGVKI